MVCGLLGDITGIPFENSAKFGNWPNWRYGPTLTSKTDFYSIIVILYVSFYMLRRSQTISVILYGLYCIRLYESYCIRLYESYCMCHTVWMLYQTMSFWYISNRGLPLNPRRRNCATLHTTHMVRFASFMIKVIL